MKQSQRASVYDRMPLALFELISSGIAQMIIVIL